MKSGEIMLNLNASNFRVLTEEGYSAESVTATTSTDVQVVLYPMISIGNKHFIYQESLQWMIEQAANTFSDNIFYLDSTNLQKITEEIIYGSSIPTAEGISPVEKAGNKWRKRFLASETQLLKKSVQLAHKVLFWNDFLEHAQFSTIYNFVITLVGRQKTPETVRRSRSPSKSVPRRAQHWRRRRLNVEIVSRSRSGFLA